MTVEFRAASRFVVRLPVLPLARLAELAAADPATVRARLRRLVAEPAVREAIFVASPGLAAPLATWLAGADDPRVERAALRYVTRMAGRATPFGLFAGMATGAIARATRFEVGAAHRRHTRLDHNYLVELCEKLAGDPALASELRFVPNSSLYTLAGAAGPQWRYAESYVTKLGRFYRLMAIDRSDYADAAIARAAPGATRGELAAVFAEDPELAPEDVAAFVDELVSGQVLVPELQPPLTGAEPAAAVIDELARYPAAAAIREALGAAQRALAAHDAAPAHDAAEVWPRVVRALGGLPFAPDAARPCQVDLEVDVDAALGPRVIAELTRAVQLLRRIAPRESTADWDQFRTAFERRYETREVPLVDVLDEESGIGFGAAAVDTAQAPLLAGLGFPARPAPRQVAWSAAQDHLVALYGRAIARGERAIELTDADVAALAAAEPAPLADSFIVVASLAARSAAAVDDGEFRLRIHGASFGSATRLLGRFCHASPAVTELVRELCAEEARLAPGVAQAEVVHLPQGRIGNILVRPVLRELEIPYLGASGAPAAQQVPIADLRVSVVDGRVVLRSHRLGVEVRPQLAAAHDYRERSTVLYRFLCSLAYANHQGLSWSWSVLASAPFTPRVTHGRLVLAPARWRVTRAELADRGRLGMPRWVAQVDGENELPLDLDNPLAVAALPDDAPLELCELLPAPDEPCAHELGDFAAPVRARSTPNHRHLPPLRSTGCEAFVHELHVPFVRVAPAPAAAPVRRPDAVVRRFIPGASAWLYAKLYGGVASLDQVLRAVVGPVVRSVAEDGLATRWFFLRYGDPEPHLRVRWLGDPEVLAREVLPRAMAAFALAVDEGLVWRVQTDTYEREVERYGGAAGIDLAEQLFAADSEAVLAIVDATPHNGGGATRWQLALRGIDQLLGDLGFDLAARHGLVGELRDRFGAEVGMDTALQRRLGERYRLHRGAIANALAGESPFAQRSRAVAPIAALLRAAPLTRPMVELAASFLHMHVNRMLVADQRKQELVLYDLLRRHYAALRSR